MGEQRARASQSLLEPLMTPFGIETITRQMAARQRIGDVCELGADGNRLIEWDFHSVYATRRNVNPRDTGFYRLADRVARVPALGSEKESHDNNMNPCLY